MKGVGSVNSSKIKDARNCQKHVQTSVSTVCVTGATFRKIAAIRKTCPCNVYPLEPHFYIEKLGFAGVYLFFLFLLQNIDCGYSLEPPR